MKKLRYSKATKITALLLCLILCFTNMAFAAEPDIQDDITDLKSKYADRISGEEVDALFAYYANDPDFLTYYQENRAACVEILEDVLLHEITPRVMPRSVSGSLYYVNMIPVQQSTTYYCGPAAMVQSLIGMGVYSSNLSTATYNTYQETLASNMGTSGGASIPSRMVTELNKHTNNIAKYIYSRKPIGYTQEQMESDIMYSLANNRPPIVKPRTKELPYYRGLTIYHFISIKSINTNPYNSSLRKVTLVDPHYDNRYFGVHDVT